MPAQPAKQLIPRQVLFGNPQRTLPQLSPDGRHISFVAPRDGVLNVWVAPATDPAQARLITNERQRGIMSYGWAYTGEHVLYMQDKHGDENFHVYLVTLKTGDIKDVTPFENVQARLMGGSPRHPNKVLIAINNRDPQLHDVHVYDLQSGALTLVEKNEDGFVGYEVDADLNVRLAMRMTAEGGMEVLRRNGDKFEPFRTIKAEDSLTTSPIGFNAAGDKLYWVDSDGRDTAAALEMDWATGKTRVLASDERADAGGDMLLHPTERRLQAVQFDYDRSHWVVLDESIKPDFERLRKVSEGDFEVVSRTTDDKHWLVQYLVDNGPVRWYVYNRDGGDAKFLFTNRPALEGLPLTRMHTPIITARDGMKLVSYLTLPHRAGDLGAPREPSAEGRQMKPAQPLPMILLVHGGPWGRDDWGYDALHQWLANRGYAVLSVNFRGSTGFGKKFVNTADQQWGRTMHDDLLDAVSWAVEGGIADKSKIAVVGGSYGGYATLWSMTNSPDVFACGVDIVGPSNLLTLLESIPPYWAPMLEMFAQRVGDPRTEEGKKLLNERSPLTYVNQIRKPLLIGQGANDPRVKQAESDQIVKAMQDKNIPVTYVLYPDEGHGFHRPENNLSFWAITEGFLAQHLGGQYEPIGNDFEGSTVEVRAGADQAPGLKDALAQRKPTEG